MFKEYKKNDILTFGGHQYEVTVDGENRFYLKENQHYNDFVFNYLDVNKSDYVRGVLGYCNNGVFPTCNSIEDLNKLIRKLQQDCLIKEAKERYPKGTKFTPAHTPNLKGQYCISHGEFWVRDGDVLAVLKNGSKVGYAADSIDSPSEDGNTTINRNVFYKGTWAEVYNNGEHTPNYVKITNNGHAYIHHPSANEYGCSNYDYGVTPENGWVCKVLNDVSVNGGTKCYILEHNGKHYIVGNAGCMPYDDKLDKPKFEVGKYYSFNWIYSNGGGGNRTVIAKIKTINTITIDVSWRNYLWYNDSFSKYSNNDTYRLNEIADIKELSIEDVQQYLPDDHPDKIIQNNLIPGKWYKVRGTCEYIAKLIEIKDGYFITPGYFIQNDEYALSYAEHNRLINIGNKVFTEVPIEEVQQYLPDNHPDKIIKKKYTLKELIDDKIIVYIDSQEKFDKISKTGKKIKGFNHATRYWGKHCYNFKDGTYSSNSSKTNTGGYDTDCIIITIDDIIFSEESSEPINLYTDYIIGKWYKLGEWIAKFSKLEKDQFWFSLAGTFHDNYKSFEPGFLSIKIHGTPKLITDMTEVYKLFTEEKSYTSDLQLGRWYEEGDFIVYLHARNSVYGFHRDYWFKSNGFSEKGLKLCHPKKLEDKFNKYIRSQYQTEDIVSCAYDRQVFKIQELNLGIHRDRITISASGVKKRYGFLFYQGEWAEKVSSIKELNLTTQNNNPTSLFTIEKYYPETDIIMPDYDEWIKEDCLEQESTTELLLKSKNKKQKFVKLTEVKTIKL